MTDDSRPRHFRGTARVTRQLAIAFCPIDADGDEMTWATTRDLSTGGAFIALDPPLPIGTELYMELVLPGDTEPIGIEAEVRWLVPPGDELGAAGMGVEFLDMSVEAHLALERYFASLAGADIDG